MSLMGTLDAKKSAMDELTAAALGHKLRKKTRAVHKKEHLQKNDTGASKYRRPKIVQKGPLLKMGGIGGMGFIKSKLENTRSQAMHKLEHGRTVDYTPESLERMNPELLKRTCTKYRVDTSGKPDDMRSRLAELLLAERKRTAAWLKKKNMFVATQINERADEAIGEYEIEMADGINQQELIGITHRSRDGLQELENINHGRIEEIGYLDEWHKDFKPIYVSETLFEEAAAASSKQGMAWDKILRSKIMAREEIVRLFNQLLADLQRKRDEVAAIRVIVARAEEEEAQLRVKFETVQRKVGDAEKRLQDVEAEQKAAQAAAKLMADQAAEARLMAAQAKADLAACKEECDRLEAELLAKIKALEKQHAAQLEEMRLKYEQEEKELEARMAEEIAALKRQIAEEEARAKREYEQKFNEILNELKRTGKIEVDRLNKLIEEALARIAALEAQLAELDDELEKLLAQVAAAEAAADAAEAAHATAMAEVCDPDIELFRQHYDQYQYWKSEVYGRKFAETDTQTDAEPVPKIPHTDSWFKPTPRENKARPKLEPLGPPPRQQTHIVPEVQQVSLEHIVRPGSAPPDPEPELEPEPEPPAPAPPKTKKTQKKRKPSPAPTPEPAPAPTPAPSKPKPVPAPAPKPKAVKVPTVPPEPEPDPKPDKKVKKTVSLGSKPKPKPPPAQPEKQRKERPGSASAPKPKPKTPSPEPVVERPKYVKPMGVVAPQEQQKHHNERRQQIVEEKKQYAEKQKQAQKEAKTQQVSAPQFVAAKGSSNQEVVAAHLPPHLVELVKKQGAETQGAVDYKVNTNRTKTGKTQLQKELETKRQEAALQEKQHADAKKSFQDPTSKTGQGMTRYAKIAHVEEGVEPGVLEGVHAAIPNLMDGEEGARLAAAGRPDPATLQPMQGRVGPATSTAAPLGNLQEGIAVVSSPEMLEQMADETAHQWAGMAPQEVQRPKSSGSTNGQAGAAPGRGVAKTRTNVSPQRTSSLGVAPQQVQQPNGSKNVSPTPGTGQSSGSTHKQATTGQQAAAHGGAKGPPRQSSSLTGVGF